LDLAPIDIYVAADNAGNVEPGPVVGRRVPLLKWAQVLGWRKMLEQIDSNAETVDTTWPARANTFALRVRGDSMEPKFPDSAIIIVDPDSSPKVGDFVIVSQGGNEATFKQLVGEGGLLYLKPLNPRYPVIQLAVDAEVIGVVKRVEMDV